MESIKPKKFAIIGAAGFVAPRHMRAIHENGSSLLAALDTHDAVGVLDQYFPQASFLPNLRDLTGILKN